MHYPYTRQLMYILQYLIDGSTFPFRMGTDGLTHYLHARRGSGVDDDKRYLIVTYLLVASGTSLGDSGGFLEVFWSASQGLISVTASNEDARARCSESGTTSIFASGLLTEEIPMHLCSPVASRGGD